MKNYKTLTIIMLLTLAFLLVTTSLAYWGGEILAPKGKQISSNLEIGDWAKEEPTPEPVETIGNPDGSFNLSGKDGHIVVIQDGNSKKVIIKGSDGVNYDISNYSSLVIYYDGQGPFILHEPANPNVCSPWNRTVCATPGDARLKWAKAYHHHELPYYDFVFYEEGDVVLFKGEYYIAGNGSPAWNSPNMGGPNEWRKIDQNTNPYDANKSYVIGDKIIVVNSANETLVYEAVANGNLRNPLTENVDGQWNYYLTIDYVDGNVYQKGDIVKYNGNFYRAITNVSSRILPTNQAYWQDASLPNN